MTITPHFSLRKDSNMNYPVLTRAFIEANIGMELIWHCYGYKDNLPYKGKCILKGIEETNERNPVTGCNYIKPVIEHIAGTNLASAWLQGDTFTYSDDDRPVLIGEAFKLYNITYELPHLGMTYAGNNAMHITIVVRNGQDVHTIAKWNTTAKDYEVHLIL